MKNEKGQKNPMEVSHRPANSNDFVQEVNHTLSKGSAVSLICIWLNTTAHKNCMFKNIV